MNSKVCLISYTPKIERLCAAAMRSCYSNKAAHELYLDEENFPQSTVEKLINKAIELGHYSILEHGVLTFSLQAVSRVLTHQLVRHRMASFSQQSQRHVNIIEDKEWYIKPNTLKEHKVEVKLDDTKLVISYDDFMKISAEYYKMLLENINKEDARFILPNATLTNITLTANPRELRHIYSLRCDPSAQWEIRDVCWVMLALSYLIAPNIFSTLDAPAKNANDVLSKLEKLKAIINEQRSYFEKLDSGKVFELNLKEFELEHTVKGLIVKL
ncbi:MAG: FAD-dependent thymidylate synthase [Nitrososphaeria archaeon]|nr:FAD-dependent thymidylate synthase [Nitrososphaeria archaeon]